MKRPLLLFLLLFLTGFAQAQQVTPHLLDHPEKLKLAQKSILSMYNWELAKAESYLANLSPGFENHPVVPFTKAMIMYWQNAPLNLYGTTFTKHEEMLVQAAELADKMLENDEEDMEGIFFKMAARSLLMKYYADKGQTMKAVGEAKGVYKLMKKGFDLKTEFNEFYFTTGVYNYYREYYPERYPVYKPFAWVFQSGDKVKGLQELEYAARNATFTSPEAYTYLTYIYLRYEHNNEKALSFAKELSQRFPKNRLFIVNHTETLMLTKSYNLVSQKADALISYQRDQYYPATGYVFKAMVYDLRDGNLDKAYEYYSKAESHVESLGSRFVDMKAYLYYGLSKYWSAKGDGDKAKDYYKKAKDEDVNDYLKTVDKPDFK